MLKQAHVGDTGTRLRKIVMKNATESEDISSATLIELVFKGPGGKRSTLAGSFVTDGTDGQVDFITVETTWSVKGRWLEQVHFITPDGEWHCRTQGRTVKPIL